MEKILRCGKSHVRSLLVLAASFIFLSASANQQEPQSLQEADMTQQMLTLFGDPQVLQEFKKPVEHRFERFNFYHDYLAKYYPKVFVIREQFFINMTPDQIADSLQHLVDLFTEKPWFYFVNESKGFKTTYYWEYILDQLSYMSEFLCKAKVNNNDGTIFLNDDDPDDFFSWMFEKSPRKKGKNGQPLFDHLANKNKTVIYDFYALCFDYLIKLFNEGILLQDIGQAMTYYSELEFVAEKLENSIYEAEYKEHLKQPKIFQGFLSKDLVLMMTMLL